MKTIGALFLGLILAGCGDKGYIRAEAIDGLVDKVSERHDAMLNGTLDPKSVSPEDKATYLRSTQILREAINAAKNR